MITLTVKGQTFNIPENGNRNWGSQVTAWMQAVSLAVSDLTVAGDIKLISVTVANAQTSAANVENLSFDTATVRHAIVEYAVYRVTDSNEVSQAGQMFLTYYSNTAEWEIIDNTVGNAEIGFSITDAGQVQYVTTTLGGSSHVGKMSFRARVFPS